jgi:hypothetical protein
MTPVEKAHDILDVIDVAHANGITPNLGPLDATVDEIRNQHTNGDPHGYRSIFFVALVLVFVVIVVGGSFTLGYLTGVSAL